MCIYGIQINAAADKVYKPSRWINFLHPFDVEDCCIFSEQFSFFLNAFVDVIFEMAPFNFTLNQYGVGTHSLNMDYVN